MNTRENRDKKMSQSWKSRTGSQKRWWQGGLVGALAVMASRAFPSCRHGLCPGSCALRSLPPEEAAMRKKTKVVASVASLICLVSSSAGATWTIDSPGSYVLNQDRINDEIRITSSDVTLDCQNHKVWRDSTVNAPIEPCSGGRHGIWVEKDGFWVYNVTIRNCDVAGWDSGIRGVYVESLNLSGNVAKRNWDGFDINQGRYVSATGNVAAVNGGFCAAKNENNGDGFDLDLVHESNFSNNHSYSNFDHGFTVNNFKQACGTWFNVNLWLEHNHIFANQGRAINFKHTQDGGFRHNFFESISPNRQGNWKPECSNNPTVCGNLCGNSVCAGNNAC